MVWFGLVEIPESDSLFSEGLVWFGLVKIPESDSLFSEGKREGSGVFGDGERGRGGKTGV